MRQTNTVEVRSERARYRVESVLGRSDALSIFLVQREDGERFAMKLFHGTAGDAQALERFEREVQLGTKLHHPSVVRIRDHGVRSGEPFLVMDLVEGRTLADLRRKGKLTIEQSVRRVAELARILHAVHEGGVVHRDLQPGHVIVSDAGTLHLTGFAVTDDSPQGGGVETAYYLAPEQVQGGQVDRRTDIHAMAVILYELLTGERPFDGASEAETRAKVVQASPRPPSRVSADSPPSLDAVVLEALAKAPSSRTATAAAFASALEEVLPRLGRPAVALSSERRALPVRKVAAKSAAPKLAAGILGVALLAALGIVLSMGGEPQHASSPEAVIADASGQPASPSAAEAEPSTEPWPEPSPTASVITFSDPPRSDPRDEPGADEPIERIDMSQVGEIPEARPMTGQERGISNRLNALFREYDLQGMLEEAERAVEGLPESGWVQVLLAKSLMHHGRYWDAIDALDEAYVLDPGLVLVDPRFDKTARSLAKALRNAPIDLDAPPAVEDWRQVFGGIWQREEGGTLVSMIAGWAPNNLTMLVSTRPAPARARYSVRVELGHERAVGLGSAGLALGQRDAENTFVVMLAHLPGMLQRELGEGQINAFRNQHGVFPKRLYLGQLTGFQLKVLKQWTLPFPDSGWVELEVTVEGRDLQLKVGDWTQRASLPRSAEGRWGLAKMFQTVARFRDWELEPLE